MLSCWNYINNVCRIVKKQQKNVWPCGAITNVYKEKRKFFFFDTPVLYGKPDSSGSDLLCRDWLTVEPVKAIIEILNILFSF